MRAGLSKTLERSWIRYAVVTAAYLAFTALWFHELMLNIGSAVLYGPNDASYGIRQYWGAEFQGQNPFTQTRDELNGAPEGLPIGSAVQIANFLIPGAIWGMHYLVGLTVASNLYLLGGLVLTGTSFYVLLERMGIHPLPAFFAGYAVTFNPWMMERAGSGHSGFMQAWIFPLVIALLLYQHRRRTVLSAVFVGLGLALAFYDNSYYGLMAALVVGVFWIVDVARQPTWRERLWCFTLADVALLAAVVAFLPPLLVWRTQTDAVSANISNAAQHVQNLGATAESYVLPSFRHPYLSGITRHFAPRSEFVWSENTLYLGWTLIALGVAGLVLVARRHPFTYGRASTRYFLVAMAVLAPAAFVFSLKRETSIFGIDVPMPSYAISEFTYFWRVFARFGLLVTFALAALSAVVLTLLIRRFRWGLAATVAAFALLAFEYYGGIPPIYHLKQAPYSEWIEEQPPGIVANYPLPTDNPAALRLLAETYYQQIYNEHPQFMLFGSGYGGTREDAIRVLVRYVTDPNAPAMLKANGVKYVLLHDDVYRKAGEDPPTIPEGFHLLERIPGNVRALGIDRDVQPADIEATLEANAAAIALPQGLPTPALEREGFLDGGATLRGEAAVRLSWEDTRLRRVNVIFAAQSRDVARRLQVVDEDGAVVAQAELSTSAGEVVLGPLSLDGFDERFTLRTEPPGPVDVTSISAQPLADFSVSLRDF